MTAGTIRFTHKISECPASQNMNRNVTEDHQACLVVLHFLEKCPARLLLRSKNPGGKRFTGTTMTSAPAPQASPKRSILFSRQCRALGGGKI